jgi:hypothetical protein
MFAGGLLLGRRRMRVIVLLPSLRPYRSIGRLQRAVEGRCAERRDTCLRGFLDGRHGLSPARKETDHVVAGPGGYLVAAPMFPAARCAHWIEAFEHASSRCQHCCSWAGRAMASCWRVVPGALEEGGARGLWRPTSWPGVPDTTQFSVVQCNSAPTWFPLPFDFPSTTQLRRVDNLTWLNSSGKS